MKWSSLSEYLLQNSKGKSGLMKCSAIDSASTSSMPGLGDFKGVNRRQKITCPIQVHAHNEATVPEEFV